MELTNGVHLQIIETDKFKDFGIGIRFLSELKEESAASRSLLALMLCDRCVKYDTKKKMSDEQDALYGMTLSAQTVGYGKAQVLEIRSRVIDPIYVEQDNLLEGVLNFLQEVIFHPLLNEETFEESKKILRSKMKRMRDDPSQYVITNGLKLGGAGTPLAISALGEIEQLEKTTLQDIQALHMKLLKEDRIDFLVCGRCKKEKIKKSILQYFPFTGREAAYKTHYALKKEESHGYVEENRDITQSSVFMLWSSGIDICDKDYYPLRVANAMFGQYPTSLLFQEVREKHSLCYSIFSNMISFDGALGVTTGVEKEHIEQAVDLIHAQFQRICDGDYPDSLLEVTKGMMINSLLATKDSMNSLIAHAYQNTILSQELSIDERIELVKQVQKEDVKRAFQACRFQLTFVVSKEDTNEENK